MSLDSAIEGAKQTLAALLLRKEEENKNAEKDLIIEGAKQTPCCFTSS